MRNITSIFLGSVTLLVATVSGSLYGCPQYNVYSARLSGEATLAEAQSSRMAKVTEAKADYESAQYNAKAEVERAKGTRDANNIVISSFGSTEDRLEYLKIQAFDKGMKEGTVIYVPTDSVLPTVNIGKR